MTARLFVCTTCDRYAASPGGPTRGEAMLAAARMEAERHGIGFAVHSVACVNSCPRPAGAALRDGRGGGMVRFVLLAPADAPALVGLLARRLAGQGAEMPAGLAGRVAAVIPPRRPPE